MNTERKTLIFFMASILLLNVATEAKKYPIDNVLKKIQSFFQERDPYINNATELELAGKKIFLEGIEVTGLKDVVSTLAHAHKTHLISGELSIPELNIVVKNVNKDVSVKYIENLQVHVKDVNVKVSGKYNKKLNQVENVKIYLNIQSEQVIKSYMIDGQLVDGSAVENEPSQIVVAYFEALEKELTEKIVDDFNKALKAEKN